jgi:hypothetical protein
MQGNRKASSVEQSVRLDNAPLDYAPEKEQGVVFLFAHLASRRYGLRVERVQSGYPDCMAYKRSTGERVRIEFEYRSSNFYRHRHEQRGCDWIVCWIHDWPGVPERIEVKELRREYGLGYNVWIVPIRGPFREVLSKGTYFESLSVPRQAHVDDLILYYRTAPESDVRDLFRITGPVGIYPLDTGLDQAGSRQFDGSPN